MYLAIPLFIHHRTCLTDTKADDTPRLMIDDGHLCKVAYIADKSLIGFEDGVGVDVTLILGNAAARLR